MPQYGSRMTSSVYVRGLGTRIDQPVVGLNIDNVPIINKDNFDFDLADISRIEILRGPQNILYGRNTMGGLVNIHTLSPFNFEGVRFTGEYGSQNSFKASLGIYKLFNRRHGTSLNVYATGTDGFFRNEVNNSRGGKKGYGVHDGKPSGAQATTPLWKTPPRWPTRNSTATPTNRRLQAG